MNNTQIWLTAIVALVSGALGWIWRARKTTAEAKKLEAEARMTDVETESKEILNAQEIAEMWANMARELRQENTALFTRLRKNEELLISAQRKLAQFESLQMEFDTLQREFEEAMKENAALRAENERQRVRITDFENFLRESK
jgi:predicted  nucleic acid-binding Zn-ribbon protein